MTRAFKVALVAVAVTGLVLLASIRHGSKLRAERPLQVVPKTAGLVARIEIDSFDSREAARALVDRLVEPDGMSEIEARCGLDPLEDLREVTLWVSAPENGAVGTGMLLRGRTVSAEELARCYETLVQGRGGSVTRVMSAFGSMLTSTDARSALARVDGETIVTGSVDTVSDFLAVASGSAPSLVDDEEFRRLWGRVDGGRLLTGAFIPPPRWQAALERIGQVESGGSALAGVMAVGLTISEPGGLEVLLEVRTAETAQEDGERMRSWMTKTLGEEIANPEDSKIAVDGTSVILSFSPSPREAR